MQPVKSPEKRGHYPGRNAHCLEALEGKVQQLLKEAFRAGWNREETAKVLLEIAERWETTVSSRTDYELSSCGKAEISGSRIRVEVMTRESYRDKSWQSRDI